MGEDLRGTPKFFHCGCFREFARGVVTGLTVQMRPDYGQGAYRQQIIKKNYVIYRSQSQQDRCPLLLVKDRAGWPFQLPDRIIRIEQYNQDVPKLS